MQKKRASKPLRSQEEQVLLSYPRPQSSGCRCEHQEMQNPLSKTINMGNVNIPHIDLQDWLDSFKLNKFWKKNLKLNWPAIREALSVHDQVGLREM